VGVAAFKPVVDDFARPVKHRQDTAAFLGRAPHGLPVADLQDPVPAELAGVRVPGEIDGLQVPDLVAAQPPAVRDLEQDRLTVGREPALPAQRCNPVDLIVGPVKDASTPSAVGVLPQVRGGFPGRTVPP
jgi:hypothetical protein